MKSLLITAALALAALSSTAARAETVGLRVGLEAPLYTHNKVNGQSYSYSIGDTLQPAIDVLLSFKPDPLIAFEIEGREGFASTGSGYKRTGTAIGPGIRLSPPVLPVYVRASLPIHFEPSPTVVGLRGAVGLEFSLVVLSLYLEGAADTSLAGGSGVSAFDQTTLSLGSGLWFKF